jgi:hypothetical protein
MSLGSSFEDFCLVFLGFSFSGLEPEILAFIL